MSAPTIKLNNGCQIPALGLGTWQSAAGEVNLAVKYAIDCGYRHFDCAYIYGNEKEIGDAVKEKIADGTVTRKELFITSKLWNTCHRPDLVVQSCKRSLDNFGLDYLDLYLIHWPLAYQEETDNMELFPVDANGDPSFSDVDYVDTWKEMEQCVKLGLTHSIGLSNFNSEQIERILSVASVKPVVNQIEAHPLLNQKQLVAFCKHRDIAVTAYSPLGSPARPWAKPGDPVLHLDDPRLQTIADKYKKTTTQVVLRYLVEIGMIPIPKSVNKERIRANIDMFDFKLTLNDIAALDTFNCNARICPALEMVKHKYYPFHLDY